MYINTRCYGVQRISSSSSNRNNNSTNTDRAAEPPKATDSQTGCSYWVRSNTAATNVAASAGAEVLET